MLTFAGQTLPSYVRVNKIKYPIMPKLDHLSQKINGRPGIYDFGTEMAERYFDIDITIIANSEFDVMKKARSLGQWLYYKDLQPLIFDEEPDKRYMCRVIDETDVDELYVTGKATIRFVCPSAFAEALQEKVVSFSPTNTEPFLITNNGNTDTYPVYTLNVKQPSTAIALIAADKYIQIGNSASAEKSPVATSSSVLSDNMTQYTGYTSGTLIDGGTVTGTFASNGFSLRQANYDYGEAVTGKWRGAAAIKSLSREVQNFTVETAIGLKSGDNKPLQVGRIEVYLFDVNNTILGKVALKDIDTAGHFPQIEARAGALSGGTMFAQTYGDKKGVWGNFNGILRIGKNGNKWNVFIAQVDATTKVQSARMYKEWVDTENNYTNRKLAKVQIHIGAYSDKEPITTMYIEDLKVTEQVSSTGIDSSTQVAQDLQSGDVLTIDSNKGIILRNGEPYYVGLDPNSDFFPLTKGTNQLILSPPVADVFVTYRERWL